jgi:hypothetical protein
MAIVNHLPARRSRQQQEHCGGIQQQCHRQDEISEHALVVGAEQDREIPDRPEIGLDLAPEARR